MHIVCFSYRSKIILCLLFLSLISVRLFANQADQVLVSVEWLIEHQNDSNVIIIDARSAREYAEGHIVGAVNVPVVDTFNPLRNTDRVGNLKHIATLFSDAGIRNDFTVVIYDGNTYIDAGRVFWVLEVYGHKNVKLLNGGIEGWQAYSKQTLSKVMIKPNKTDYTPAIDPHRLITKFSMRLAIDDKNKVIIDARTKEEYEGKESIALRSGHIPNAVNIPWKKHFTQNNGIQMLKPIDELNAMYDDVVSGKQILLYCNKGKQSSLSYTVLRQLGYEASHYDGSWYEWGNDDRLPISLP